MMISIRQMDVNKSRTGVCYILCYYFPRYVRTKTLIDALKRLDRLELHQAINTSTGIFRYFENLWRLLAIRIKHNPDYYILGFRGYEIFWIVRAITLGKTLIFDHMMSPYDSWLNEGRRIRKGGIVDKLVYAYEKSTLRHSEVILTDTTIHKEYFAKLFQISPNKIHAIPVGADEDLFKRLPSYEYERTDREFSFEVFFYGSFLPLHGVDIILRAAAILRDMPIQFTVVGGQGKDLSDFHQMIRQLELENVNHREWVDYEELPQWIRGADICLGGPFGNTGQARRVVTGKTFQFLAMGKPTIVGEIDQNYGFEDKSNCLLVRQGDAQALADAILWGFNHKYKLDAIGQQGWELYNNDFSVNSIKKCIWTIFQL
ncbi:MAG: glycosyltransferase [Candidatus Hodarchaeota archaeon]